MTVLAELSRLLPRDEKWKLLAACRDLDVNLFFPSVTDSRQHLQAHWVCRTCPVKLACQDYALTNKEFGVWGDTTERARQRIRKARKLAVSA